MMTNKTWQQRLRKAESGQAIVLIAMVMVALIAALGLAIDGGELYFLRHDVSNAVDAAVLASTYAICTGGDPTISGMNAAAANGFDNDGVTNTVQVHYPPVMGERAGNMSYVQVEIDAKKDPYFIHIVYHGDIGINLSAIGYCKPPRLGSAVGSVWAGGVCGSNGNEVNLQPSDAQIIGDIHSNNEVKTGGTGGGTTVQGDVSASSTIEQPVGANYTQAAGSQIENAPAQEDPLQFNVWDFANDGSIGEPIDNAGAHYQYDAGVSFGNGDTLSEGLYFIDGNLTVQDKAVFTDTDGDGQYEYTFVATGAIAFTQSLNNLTYYTMGMLAFSDDNNECKTNGGLDVSGSGLWKGVMYAPHSAIDLSGSNFTIYGALIANQVSISTSGLYLEYDPDLIPPRPPEVSIAE